MAYSIKCVKRCACQYSQKCVIKQALSCVCITENRVSSASMMADASAQVPARTLGSRLLFTSSSDRLPLPVVGTMRPHPVVHRSRRRTKLCHPLWVARVHLLWCILWEAEVRTDSGSLAPTCRRWLQESLWVDHLTGR